MIYRVKRRKRDIQIEKGEGERERRSERGREERERECLLVKGRGSIMTQCTVGLKR